MQKISGLPRKMERSVGSAVVARLQVVGEARRCDSASTAGSGKRNVRLIAGRWPAEVQGSA